jgi:hypothetical protein
VYFLHNRFRLQRMIFPSRGAHAKRSSYCGLLEVSGQARDGQARPQVPWGCDRDPNDLPVNDDRHGPASARPSCQDADDRVSSIGRRPVIAAAVRVTELP